MARRSQSRSTISIGTLIFWGILAFMWFGDNDDDKKTEVQVREQVTVEQQDSKVDVDALKKEAMDLVNQAKKEFDKAKDEFLSEKEKPVEKPKEKEEVLTAKPEEEKPKEELKPTEEKPQTDMGMKKL